MPNLWFCNVSMNTFDLIGIFTKTYLIMTGGGIFALAWAANYYNFFFDIRSNHIFSLSFFYSARGVRLKKEAIKNLNIYILFYLQYIFFITNIKKSRANLPPAPVVIRSNCWLRMRIWFVWMYRIPHLGNSFNVCLSKKQDEKFLRM